MDAEKDNQNQNQEGWRVARQKEEFYGLLLEAASGIAGVPSGDDRARINYLAEHCHVNRTTLMRHLRSARLLPSWPTLNKLVKGTGVPMRRWLLHLHVISLADAAALLEQEIAGPAVSTEGRALLEITERYTLAKRRALVTFLGLDEGAAHPDHNHEPPATP